jgi:hypothetical protein
MTGLEKRARRWVLREMNRIEMRQALGASLEDRPQLGRPKVVEQEAREDQVCVSPAGRP